MDTIATKTLTEKRAGLQSAIAQLDAEIREMAASLEQRKMNRIATDGALQVIDSLLHEASQPKPEVAAKPKK